MFKLVNKKTGESVPVGDQEHPTLFNTEKEAWEKIRIDFNRANSSMRAFAKSYDLVIKPGDLLSVKDYVVVEVS